MKTKEERKMLFKYFVWITKLSMYIIYCHMGQMKEDENKDKNDEFGVKMNLVINTKEKSPKWLWRNFRWATGRMAADFSAGVKEVRQR